MQNCHIDINLRVDLIKFHLFATFYKRHPIFNWAGYKPPPIFNILLNSHFFVNVVEEGSQERVDLIAIMA